MPAVQFRDEVNKVNITKKMFTPKKADQISAWWREARKLIPQIPDPYTNGDWRFEPDRPEITIGYIRWSMVNKKSERVHLVIDRKTPSLG
jgi:hypothetical protein